ncbi:MAG: heavy-metal-associated domain-containing protein [Gemmataceae bacterium]|nr:heavy-metal-associated domain-containing protein [Gemmataceae bacterium]
MRQLCVATVAAVALAFLGAGLAQAGKVEVKGVHLCCGQCVKAVAKVLSTAKGVSDAKCDRPSNTVTFTAQDSASAAAAVKALLDEGFFGNASEDGKAIRVEVTSPAKGDKAGEVTVKQVHVCCNQCRKMITALFKDVKVEFPDFVASRVLNEVKVTGKDLDKAEVLQTLRKAGFNGTVAK